MNRWLAGHPRRVDALGVGVLCVVHMALGMGLFGGWMFAKYPQAARLLAEGRLGGEMGGDFSPFYLLLNVALSPEPLRVVQSLLGCVGVVSVFIIGAKGFGRVAGYVGAVLYALALPGLLYEATLEPDLAITVLDVAAVAVLVASRPRENAWGAAGAGALLGLSAAFRPTALLLLVLVAGWLLVRGWRSGTWRGRLGPAGAVLAAGVVCALAPTLVVRAVAGSELGATMSAGAVIHMGNRPEGTGLGTQPPLLLKLLEHQQRSEDNPDSAHALYRRFARADEGEGLSPTETELYWMKKTAAFAWHEPWAYARLLGRKLLFLLVGPEGYDLVEVRRAAEQAEGWPLPTAPMLGLLGTLGLAVVLLRRRAEPWTLLAFVSLAAVSLLFYVVSRYRLTTVPVWCVWAGFLVSSMGEALREHRARLALGVATLGVALLFLGSTAVRRSERSLARTAAASVEGAEYGRQLAAGRLDEAMRTFVDIRAAAPFTTVLRDVRGIPFELPELAVESGQRSAERFGAETETDSFYLARLAMLAGQCEVALPTFQQLGEAGFRLAIFDHLLDPNLLAAECLLEQGQREAAREAALESVERYPGTAEGLAEVIAATEALGGSEEERAEWEE
ncbi:MAG TPA: glycosyltransferase family 39 protein, partial [Myxococcaceae bacterium]|nr:glycosyltransferase family 39 protein [Myxococcaceae bacterium]